MVCIEFLLLAQLFVLVVGVTARLKLHSRLSGLDGHRHDAENSSMPSTWKWHGKPVKVTQEGGHTIVEWRKQKVVWDTELIRLEDKLEERDKAEAKYQNSLSEVGARLANFLQVDRKNEPHIPAQPPFNNCVSGRTYKFVCIMHIVALRAL